MSALPTFSWDALEQVTDEIGRGGVDTRFPPTRCTLPPTLYKLPSTFYTLHTTLQKGEEGEEVLPQTRRVRALAQLKAEKPELHTLFKKQVASRMDVPPAKRADALKELVMHLFKAVSGAVAETLAAIDWCLNQEMYNEPMDTHLAALKETWRAREAQYPAELSPAEAVLYGDLDDDDRAAFRILRDLAITGKGEFFMGCDQLGVRLGGASGYGVLKQFGPGGYGIIEKSQDGVKRAKGVKGRAAYYKWKLPRPVTAAVAIKEAVEGESSERMKPEPAVTAEPVKNGW